MIRAGLLTALVDGLFSSALAEFVLKAAAVYGPFVWVVMSMVVIPALTRRPPTITVRWWNQFVGHAIFVGVPIVSMIARHRDRLNANNA